jgi:hypothetical protein
MQALTSPRAPARSQCPPPAINMPDAGRYPATGDKLISVARPGRRKPVSAPLSRRSHCGTAFEICRNLTSSGIGTPGTMKSGGHQVVAALAQTPSQNWPPVTVRKDEFPFSFSPQGWCDEQGFHPLPNLVLGGEVCSLHPEISLPPSEFCRYARPVVL